MPFTRTSTGMKISLRLTTRKTMTMTWRSCLRRVISTTSKSVSRLKPRWRRKQTKCVSSTACSTTRLWLTFSTANSNLFSPVRIAQRFVTWLCDHIQLANRFILTEKPKIRPIPVLAIAHPSSQNVIWSYLLCSRPLDRNVQGFGSFCCQTAAQCDCWPVAEHDLSKNKCSN